MEAGARQRPEHGLIIDCRVTKNSLVDPPAWRSTDVLSLLLKFSTLTTFHAYHDLSSLSSLVSCLLQPLYSVPHGVLRLLSIHNRLA